MAKITLLFSLFLVLSFLDIFSQNTWIIYNHTNTPVIGPIHNVIRDITTDTSGNMWFATYNGISKYNENIWENILYISGSSQKSYQNIIIDKENTIWLSNRYWHGGFAKIKNNNYELICEGKRISDMVLDTAGHIWIVAWEGLFEYTESEFIDHSNEHEFLNIDNNLNSICFDKNNKLCIATANNGILYKKDTTWVNFTETDGLPDNYICDIDFDSVNNLWIATYEGVSCYNGIDFTNYTVQDGLCSNKIHSLYVDNDNYIWFESYDKGLSFYNGEEFITYNAKTGLKDNYINAVFKDKNKGVWISYEKDGVDCLKNDTIINFSGNGIYHIRSLYQDNNNNIWVGTEDGGINVFDGTNWKNYNLSNGFIDNSIYTIVGDAQQNIWASTPNGLAKYKDNKFEYIPADSLPGKHNITLYFDKNNNMWIGTANNGAAKFNGKVWTKYNSTNSPIMPRVDAICEDNKGNIWFSTSDTLAFFEGKICKFDGNNWDSYQPAQGVVRSIFNDSEGNMWFGLHAGFYKDTTVLKYDGENWEAIVLDLKEPYENYTNILSIAEDKSGNILFGRSHYGVSIYNNGKWEHKYFEDGYPDLIYTILVDNTGDIWFGSGYEGLYRLKHINDIKNIKHKNNFNIHPNPVKDVLHIKNEHHNNKTTKVELYNISGKLLYSNYYNSNYELNMSIYPKGVYILKLKYLNSVYVNKIVKE